MTRDDFLGILLGLTTLPLVACSATEPEEDPPELVKSKEQWRALLTPAAFAVLFEDDTEPPGSSPLNDEHRNGTFLCAACLVPLFLSDTKYDSGTGWPSFWDPIKDRVGTRTDRSQGLVRTEYHCRRCGGHQGHVFDDGPIQTGKRWCNNGVALQFVAQGEVPPPLRS